MVFVLVAYHNEPEELFMYTNMSANCEPLDLIQPWQLKDEAQEDDNHQISFTLIHKS